MLQGPQLTVSSALRVPTDLWQAPQQTKYRPVCELMTALRLAPPCRCLMAVLVPVASTHSRLFPDAAEKAATAPGPPGPPCPRRRCWQSRTAGLPSMLATRAWGKRAQTSVSF